MGALDGVRVLDLSNFLAAPMAGMFLADFGAEVLKVERPGGGDEMRQWGNNKDGVGLYYKVVNRNKKSVTLDLRTPFGRDAALRLASESDIVLENYRPGTLEKWGLGYEALSANNPGLVLVRVSGFGQTGPNSHRPGFGTLAEAYAGFAHINGEAGGPPLLPGFGLADSTTGLMAAFLAMVALKGREANGGRGQVVDLAIYESLFTLLGPQVVDFDQLGKVQMRNGSRLPFTAPRNTYRTSDGRWVSMAGSAQSIFVRVLAALEVPGLAADPRFADNRARLVNAEALDVELQKAFSRFDLTEIMRRFDEAQAAVAPVNDVAAIFADPHFQARENITSVVDPELGGPVRMQNVAGKLSDTPGAVRWAATRVGEHNREILVDRLGIDPAAVRAAGLPLDS
ncbi:MAG: CoA transferase [Betaproteobacteria bacterium]|nr:CoA transferase [Betaproteobacteria bacterium]